MASSGPVGTVPVVYDKVPGQQSADTAASTTTEPAPSQAVHTMDVAFAHTLGTTTSAPPAQSASSPGAASSSAGPTSTTSATPAPTTTTPPKPAPPPPTTAPAPTTTVPPPPAHSATGEASWYNAPAGTCASPDLAFGTVVTVTDLATGASVHCTVDDREADNPGRVIDLAPATFSQLASTSAGLIEVRLTW